MKYKGCFPGSRNADRDILVYDPDVDITIAVGDHPYSAHPFYREVLPQGNIAAYYRPNQNTSGLSALQKAVSTTPYGQTWRLKLNADGTVLSRTELEDELAVREGLAVVALEGDDSDEELVREVACSFSAEEVKRHPFQGRSNLVLNQELVADDAAIASMDKEEVEETFQVLLHSEQRSVQPALRKLLAARDLPTTSMEGILLEALGVGPIIEREKTDPPEMKTYWGLPGVVYRMANLRPKEFRSAVLDMKLTCGEVSEMAVQEHGNPIPYLAKREEKLLALQDIHKVLMDEERKYFREYEAWANGAEVPVRLMNMGTAIESIRENLEEDYGIRPRQSIMDEALSAEALGEHEQSMLERDLLRKVTPRDEQVFMGELSPFAADVPYIVTQEGKFVGHPVAYIIQSMLDALNEPYDPRFLFDEDGESLFDEVETTRLLGVTMDRVITLSGKNYFLCRVGSSQGLAETEQNADGTWTVHLRPVCPSAGFDYEVMASDRDLLGCAGPDGDIVDVGSVVCFDSRVEYVAWRAEHARVPTIQQDSMGQTVIERDAIQVTWKPLSEVFPAVTAFLARAVEYRRDGEGLGQDQGFEQDIPELMWDIQQELTAYQRRMLEAVAETNIELSPAYQKVVDLMEEGYAQVQSAPETRLSGGYETAKGEQSSLFGAIMSFLIAGSDEESVLPAPAKVVAERDGAAVWGVNERVLWRAMGYELHPDKFQPGLEHLDRMVKETIFHSAPMTVSARRHSWRDDDGTVHSYREMAALTPWTETGFTRTGLLGDAVVEWWRTCVGLALPCVRGNILCMSAGEIAEKLGWSQKEAVDFCQRTRNWGALKEERNHGLASLIRTAFPEGNFRQNIQQAQLYSYSPLLTAELMQTAVELVELGGQGRAAFLRLCQADSQSIGTVGMELLEGLLA